MTGENQRRIVPVYEQPPRMDIVIEPQLKRIVVTQRWCFFLRPADSKQSSKPFHVYGANLTDIRDDIVIKNYFSQLRKAALDVWNDKLEVVAKDRRTHDQNVYRLVFEIELVKSRNDNPHWEVRLCLSNKDFAKEQHDQADWKERTIDLYLNSMNFREIRRQVEPSRASKTRQLPRIVESRQVTVAHEFGHTLGNTSYLHKHADEYSKKWNAMLSEDEYRSAAYKSVMNIGNEVRARHVDYIVEQLRRFMGRTTDFLAREVKPGVQ